MYLDPFTWVEADVGDQLDLPLKGYFLMYAINWSIPMVGFLVQPPRCMERELPKVFLKYNICYLNLNIFVSTAGVRFEIYLRFALQKN